MMMVMVVMLMRIMLDFAMRDIRTWVIHFYSGMVDAKLIQHFSGCRLGMHRICIGGNMCRCQMVLTIEAPYMHVANRENFGYG